jgi:hypothetical protein
MVMNATYVNTFQIRTVDKDGSIRWTLNGVLHREDGPAYEQVSGTKWWYLNGVVHRIGGPAIIFNDGAKHWYLNGKMHREDGPAAEYAGGTKHWYLDGESIIVRNPDSPSFKKRWERLVGEYHIKRIMNE